MSTHSCSTRCRLALALSATLFCSALPLLLSLRRLPLALLGGSALGGGGALAIGVSALSDMGEKEATACAWVCACAGASERRQVARDTESRGEAMDAENKSPLCYDVCPCVCDDCVCVFNLSLALRSSLHSLHLPYV